jgi:hypothetical protein
LPAALPPFFPISARYFRIAAETFFAIV